MRTINPSEAAKNFRPYQSYIFLGISIVITISTAFFIYYQIESLFFFSLQEKIKAITQTASLQFSTKELDQIRGPESVNTDVYQKVVLKMQAIRLQNPSLEFVDIYRRTDAPNLFEYVADADSLHPDIPIDLNEDGIIDDMDALNYPGDIYDGSEVPNFVENAFIKTDVDPALESSQWGQTLDASSPIFYDDDNSRADYVFNISVNVTEFVRQTSAAFIPFVLFVIILIIILTLLTVILVNMWASRLDVLKELDRQKDELLGLVSHQLATPVSSIKWYLEMLQDGDLGELTKEQKEHVASMHGIGENMSDLVGMILDVSRIQLGRIKVEKQDLNLNEFFQEIISTIEPKAIEKKVTFVKNIPKNLPVAKLDRRYTNMTIENLLSNAVKYTPAGGKVNFDVTLKGKNLSVRVSDTGMGIPKADQAKIFGRMFRASNVRNAVDGNGFGLFVAKGAVEAQGGKIWFKSEEGKGTTFFVDLPLE